ncbi:DoxX family protein [Flammeovirgaceae bacterium 311]|nr:DoxX family protein [Flammeovirgaceae bacterium 311]
MKAALYSERLAPYSHWGLLILRIAFAVQLIQGTQDNVFSWERMLEFRDFLDARGVLAPLIAAHVSAYAQFICGILWIIGWQTRLAAAIMVINFIAALIIVHIGLPYEQNFPAINLLAVALCLMLTGPGKISLDYRLPHL